MHIGDTEQLYTKAVIHLDGLVSNALEYVPGLITEHRSDVVIHRIPDKTLDVVYALKLLQLAGSLKSGETLVKAGHYFEWDMVKRLIYETLDDLQFLSLGEENDDWTDVHEQYMRAFFAEDFADDGTVVTKSVHPVPRYRITNYLKGSDEDGNEERIGRTASNISRLFSANVHGRATGIIRGYYEAHSGKFWNGGTRDELIAVLERFALYLATSQVLNFTSRIICARWWDSKCTEQTMTIATELGRALQGTQLT